MKKLILMLFLSFIGIFLINQSGAMLTSECSDSSYVFANSAVVVNGTILKYLYNAYFNEGNWTRLKNISDTVSQKSVDEQISNAFDNP